MCCSTVVRRPNDRVAGCRTVTREEAAARSCVDVERKLVDALVKAYSL